MLKTIILSLSLHTEISTYPHLITNDPESITTAHPSMPMPYERQ